MSLLFKSGARSGAVENRTGVLLYELAAEAGFPINMPCGGNGTCRRCTVLLGTGAYRIAGKKVTVAAGETLEARACKTEVLCDDAVIHIPATSLFKAGR